MDFIAPESAIHKEGDCTFRGNKILAPKPPLPNIHFNIVKFCQRFPTPRNWYHQSQRITFVFFGESIASALPWKIKIRLTDKVNAVNSESENNLQIRKRNEQEVIINSNLLIVFSRSIWRAFAVRSLLLRTCRSRYRYLTLVFYFGLCIYT